MEDNIISLVDNTEEQEENSYIKIYFTDTSTEIIPCDYFGGMEGLTNFIAIFQNASDDMPTNFFNTTTIKSIKVLKESQTLESNGVRMEKMIYD